MSRYSSAGPNTRLRAALIVIAAAFLLAGCRTLEDMSFSKIDPAVVEALTATGRAEVMVSLVPPRGYGVEGADLAATKIDIARAQDDVLGSLGSLGSDFYQNRIRFDAIPGLAGTVLDRRVLAVFEGHELVQRVTLDTGGIGH